jgi:hypothetical protein
VVDEGDVDLLVAQPRGLGAGAQLCAVEGDAILQDRGR